MREPLDVCLKMSLVHTDDNYKYIHGLYSIIQDNIFVCECSDRWDCHLITFQYGLREDMLYTYPRGRQFSVLVSNNNHSYIGDIRAEGHVG